MGETVSTYRIGEGFHCDLNLFQTILGSGGNS